MEKFCIIIPVYKESLDCIEKISLNRLYTVIGKKNYHVYLLKPKELDISEYKKIYPDLLELNINDSNYFKNTYTYSQLLITPNIYKILTDKYLYMYIYQLDCYLFYDNLEKWCDMRYDYIGAPIFSEKCGWNLKTENNKNIPKVGNGGFSLRRISVFYHLCSVIYDYIPASIIESQISEDIFFCDVVPMYYNILQIPDWNIATYFSWDMSPDIPYDRYNIINFPMAAHAIGKNIRFYKYYIDEFKNNDIIEYCENKYKDFFQLYYTDNWRSTIYVNKNNKIDTNY